MVDVEANHDLNPSKAWISSVESDLSYSSLHTGPAHSPLAGQDGMNGQRILVADPSGLLTCLDGYMNVALEDTEEVANGRVTARYGDCFVRGNNGMPCLVLSSDSCTSCYQKHCRA